MSLAQKQTLSQVSGKNCFPTDTAKFSRQLVPLRANCSLSVREGEGGRERKGEGGR